MRKSLLSASLLAGLFILSVSATPALAAPEWSISLEHHNAYGAQQSSCPTGKEEYFPSEPEKDCGVDPFTGSGTTFDRESGYNEYEITVKNTGTGEAAGLGAGSSLACESTTAAFGATEAVGYQWLRSGSPIAGAAGRHYTTVSADEGEALQCAVTASNKEGGTQVVSNALVMSPAPATAPPAISTKPTVTGAASVGGTMTCSTGSWTNSPVAYSYQWVRNGLALIGQTASTHAVTPSDRGTALQCDVVAENGGGKEAVDTLPKLVLSAIPSASVEPSITGTGTEAGESLSCNPGTWSGSPLFSYQWLRNGNPIFGATAASYVLVGSDEGKSIQCEVIAANEEGSGVAVSPSAVTSSPPVAPATIAVSGSEEVTETLTCEHESWSGSPTVYEYQWLRNGAVIAGATSGPTEATTFTYTLTPADANKTIQCEVIAANSTASTAAFSAATTDIEPSIPFFNSGGEASIRGGVLVEVVDHLPLGLVLAGKLTSEEASGSGWECTISSPVLVACQRSDTLASGASYPPIVLHVHVESDVPAGTPPHGGITNTASISGGGGEATVASDPTIITTVPFGIETFATSVVNSLASPFTQAGGHPFVASAFFSFNSIPSDTGTLKTAGGAPKDIETELPPGFIGNPQAAPKCESEVFEAGEGQTPCPQTTAVGFIHFTYDAGVIDGGQPALRLNLNEEPIYNLAPAPGRAASFGFVAGLSFAREQLTARIRSDGDYGVTISSPNTVIPALLAASVTFCSYGVVGEREVEGNELRCAASTSGEEPFLTTPTRCSGRAQTTTLRADTYEQPSEYASKTVYNGAMLVDGAPSATESLITGCNLLQFAPEVEYGPSGEAGTSQAGQPSGSAFDLKVPQSNGAETPATPELKDATVTLPEGMSADPSSADGLEACSNAQFGLGSTVEPAEPATCPSASQIGTVKVVTPLLEKPLEGQVFIGEPECSPCSSGDAEQGHLFRLFLQLRLPERGVVVKLAGKVSASAATGRLQATFTEQPQLPFSELILTLKGGPRAPLANPQTCGPATTTADLTPWSAPGLGGLSGAEQIEGTPDATPASSFNVDWDGKGGACPATLPFSPSFLAQTASSTVGQYSPLSVSFGRPQPASESEERDEQNFAGISLNMPEGLLGKIAGVERCPEAQASAGTCSSASAIGTTTVAAGTGSHPFYLGGTVYLTGPYRGASFGLSIVVPAKAGPFTLAGTNGQGDVVVRAAISVNPSTAALTVTSDPLPQIVDGVPLRLHSVRVDVNRPEFTLNPTSCAAQQITASLVGEPVNNGEAGKTASASSQFTASNCAALPFNPSLSAQTQAKTSKADGASLKVVVAQKPGEANIAKVDVQLPKQLPARLTTLQKACLAATFQSNPAACPAASIVGMAVAHTPLLSSALTGPAILVSHGGAAFPDLEVVLQGEGVTLILDGGTDIKAGVTYSRFDTVPDAPISSFELNLPEGSDSVLATDIPASAENSLCGSNLVMPTTITGQNGKQIIQTTKITTGACTKVKTKTLTRAQKLAKALKACRTKYKAKNKKSKRVKCEKQARKKYGPLRRAKKKAKKSSSRNGKAGR